MRRKSRPFSGRSCTCFCDTTLASAVDWTSSVVPVTCTVSFRFDTPSLISTAAIFDTATSTLTFCGWNPSMTASTVYVPSGKSGSEKSPVLDVTVVRLTPVPAFVAVTVTPGRTPPL